MDGKRERDEDDELALLQSRRRRERETRTIRETWVCRRVVVQYKGGETEHEAEKNEKEEVKSPTARRDATRLRSSNDQHSLPIHQPHLHLGVCIPQLPPSLTQPVNQSSSELKSELFLVREDETDLTS